MARAGRRCRRGLSIQRLRMPRVGRAAPTPPMRARPCARASRAAAGCWHSQRARRCGCVPNITSYFCLRPSLCPFLSALPTPVLVARGGQREREKGRVGGRRRGEGGVEGGSESRREWEGGIMMEGESSREGAERGFSHTPTLQAPTCPCLLPPATQARMHASTHARKHLNTHARAASRALQRGSLLPTLLSLRIRAIYIYK